jgi:DinB superfamily
MAPVTPYSEALAGRDPVVAVAETTARIEAITSTWTADSFERSYAPGKWSARQILIHLAHAELAFGNRSRMALSTPGYAAQNFDQDAWMRREQTMSGRDAADAFLVLARMNAALFKELPAADRDLPFSHPEYGSLTVDWVIHQAAGHQIHHLKQLEQIGILNS